MAHATLSHSLVLSSSRFSRLGYSTRFLRHASPLSLPLTRQRFRCYCSDQTSVRFNSPWKLSWRYQELGRSSGFLCSISQQDTYETLFFIVDLRAITLPYDPQELEYDNAERPECNNLLSVYQIVSGKTKEEVMEECKDMSWGTFKPLLTDAVVEHLSPIQVRYQEITAASAYLDKVLSEGADRATEIAEVNSSQFETSDGVLYMRNSAQWFGWFLSSKFLKEEYDSLFLN